MSTENTQNTEIKENKETLSQEKLDVDKRDRARLLYIQSRFTQAQIAQTVGVSQKTISVWAADGKWVEFIDTLQSSPFPMAAQLSRELNELNQRIANREPPNNLPTIEEINLRNKLLNSVALVNKHLAGENCLSVLARFCEFIDRSDGLLHLTVKRYANDFLRCSNLPSLWEFSSFF